MCHRVDYQNDAHLIAHFSLARCSLMHVRAAKFTAHACLPLLRRTYLAGASFISYTRMSGRNQGRRRLVRRGGRLRIAGLKEARLMARLLALPHHILASVAAESLLSEEGLRTAERLLSLHAPVAPWAVSEILLSVDLMPSIFAALTPEESSAAAVCKAWQQAWMASAEARRILGPAVSVDPPDFGAVSAFASMPSLLSPWKPSLWIYSCPFISEFEGGEDDDEEDDPNMMECISIADSSFCAEVTSHGRRLRDERIVENRFVAPGNGYMYGIDAGGSLCQFRVLGHGKMKLTEARGDGGYGFTAVTMGPTSALRPLYALRCSIHEGGRVVWDVQLFDALSFLPTGSFGGGHLPCPCDLAVVGNELYVMDLASWVGDGEEEKEEEELVSGGRGQIWWRCRLQVFALPGGEYLREVRGDDLSKLRCYRMHPGDNSCFLEYHKGRLYAAETSVDGCICVLTPEGRTLQIYDLEWASIKAMTIFDDKLVVSGRSVDGEPVTEVLHGL